MPECVEGDERVQSLWRPEERKTKKERRDGNIEVGAVGRPKAEHARNAALEAPEPERSSKSKKRAGFSGLCRRMGRAEAR